MSLSIGFDSSPLKATGWSLTKMTALLHLLYENDKSLKFLSYEINELTRTDLIEIVPYITSRLNRLFHLRFNILDSKADLTITSFKKLSTCIQAKRVPRLCLSPL